MLICEVPDAAQLPPLYTTLAQYSKAGCICAVQALANSCSAEADSTNIAPIITPALFECIKQDRRAARQEPSGLLIYLIMRGLGTKAMAAQEKQTTYATIYLGGGAPQISQVVKLTTATPTMVKMALALLQVY